MKRFTISTMSLALAAGMVLGTTVDSQAGNRFKNKKFFNQQSNNDSNNNSDDNKNDDNDNGNSQTFKRRIKRSDFADNVNQVLNLSGNNNDDNNSNSSNSEGSGKRRRFDIVKTFVPTGDQSDIALRFNNRNKSLLNMANLSSNFSQIMQVGNEQSNNADQQKAIQFAKKQMNLSNNCHWWVNVAAASYSYCHNSNWDYCYYPGYWQCWKPCDWYTVYCPHTDYCDASQWYLGLAGIIVPDTGLGIQDVKLGSPAYHAGLRPGQMIVGVNGQPLLDEVVLIHAIQASHGVLVLDVITDDCIQPHQVIVHLARVKLTKY